MAADTGLFSEGKNPRTLESESKRHVMVTAQKPPLGDKGRPITDATFNAQGKIMFNMIRRLAQHGVGNGPTSQSLFKITGSTSTDNYFTITTAGSTDYETMPTFLLGGLQAILPISGGGSVALETASAAESQWLHLRTDASATGAQTVFTCSNALWPNLGARTVYLQLNDGTWIQKTLASNTNSTFTISVAATVGAAGGEVPPNAYFFFAPTTPVGARTDAVWLDVFLQEVGGVTPLSGTTVAAYTDSSIDDVIGTTSSYETARRFRVKQHVFVEQSTDDGTTFIDGGGTAISNNAMWWVDAGGVTHVSVRLASLSRTTNAKILPHMVADSRVSVGEAASSDAATVLYDLARGAWIGTLPSVTRTNATTATIGSGETFCTDGVGGYVLRTVPSRAFTARSDGTAWGSTDNYFYANLTTGQYECETAIPGADVAPVARVLTAGTLPGAFTVGADYDDLRRSFGDGAYGLGLSNRFRFNADGQAMAPLLFGRYGDSTDTPGVILNDTATSVGELYCDEDKVVLQAHKTGGVIALKNTNANSPGIHVGGTSGATADTIYIDGGAGAAVVEAYDMTDISGGGTDGPATWKMREVRSTHVRAPHVEFGSSTLATAPIVGTIWAPAAEGYLRHEKGIGLSYDGTVHGGSDIGGVATGGWLVTPDKVVRRHYDTVVWDANQTDASLPGSVTGLTSALTAVHNSLINTGLPFLTIPLRVTRGTRFDYATLVMRATFSQAAPGMTFKVWLSQRVDGTTVEPVGVASSDFTLYRDGVSQHTAAAAANDSFLFDQASSGSSAEHAWTWKIQPTTTIYMNTGRRLYLHVSAESGTDPEITTNATNALWFLGVESTVSIRGIGTKPTTPDVNNYISYPFEGL